MASYLFYKFPAIYTIQSNIIVPILPKSGSVSSLSDNTLIYAPFDLVANSLI